MSETDTNHNIELFAFKADLVQRISWISIAWSISMRADAIGWI